MPRHLLAVLLLSCCLAPAPRAAAQEEGLTISGRVIVPEGEGPSATSDGRIRPQPGLVGILALSKDGQVEASRRYLAGEPTSYVFSGLAPGRYELRFIRLGDVPAGTLDSVQTVQLTSEPATVDLELRPLAPERGFFVHSRGPSGEPLPDVHVWIGGGHHVRPWSRRGRHVGVGEFWIDLRERRTPCGSTPCPACALFLIVESAGFGARVVDLPSGLEGHTTVAFSRPARVEVLAVGHRLEDQPAMHLELRSTDRRTRTCWADLDERGGARLGPVQPGRYTLRLKVALGGSTTIEYVAVHAEELELVAGEERLVALTAPTLHELTLVVCDLASTERVDLAPAGADPPWVFYEDAAPRLRFENVPAGTYRVRRYVRGSGAARVTEVVVPAAGEVVLD